MLLALLDDCRLSLLFSCPTLSPRGYVISVGLAGTEPLRFGLPPTDPGGPGLSDEPGSDSFVS